MRWGPDVHVTLRWGPTVVRTARVPASEPLVLGVGPWSVPDESLGAVPYTLLRPDRDGIRIELPTGSHLLKPGAKAHVELGAVSVGVEVDSPAARPPRTRPRLAALLHPLGSAVLHASAIGIVALWTPPLAANEPSAEQAADTTAFLLAALDANASRERDETPKPVDSTQQLPPGDANETRPAGGTGTRSNGAEGAQGNPRSELRGHRMAIQGPKDTPDPSVAREAAARAAEAFGIIGLLNTGPAAAPDAPLVTWGRDTSAARDPANSRAPLFGATIHDAFAWGGVGLSGVGEGGGGRAEAIGLGDIGAIGLGAGTGTGDAFGAGGFGGSGIGEGGGGMGQGIGLGSFGAIGRDAGFSGDRGWFSGVHRVRTPRIRISDGDGCLVTGRLPPEAIQRVVRQNLGRFRACYQRGLDKNPALGGRVSTKFLIGRDGTVGFSADDGSDMADTAVTACVVRTFTALEFPEPTGGTVMVVYPFTFTPE